MAGPEREIVGVLLLSTFEVLGREPMALPIWSICSLSVNGNLKLGFLASIVEFVLSNLAHVMCSLLSALRVILLVLLHQAIG